jgi:PhnB protein
LGGIIKQHTTNGQFVEKPRLLKTFGYECEELDRLKNKFSITIKIKIMASINPHINFNGNAEEAFNFYKSVFGGEYAKIMRFKDLASAEFPVAENEANKIMHIALPIGKNILMANDVPEILGRTNENENRSKIVISAESKEEADKLFNGLSVGGQIEMPISDSPWGSYFGMFRDKYGIEWMVDFDSNYKGQI